jgi:DNA-binding beta-propeller fold protein YncE
MVNIPGSPGFDQLVFADGMLLMTHPGAQSMDIFDPARRRVVARVTGLQLPRGIAVDEKGGRVYLADHDAGSIVVIATDGWKVLESIKVPGAPDELLLDGAGKLFWTDPEAGAIALLDLQTKQDVAQTNVGGTPRALAYDAARKIVFATLQDVHQIAAIDPQLKIVSRFNLNASQPTGLVYDPQYHELYVAVRFAVLAINADTGAEVDRVAAPPGVDSLWLDPQAHKLYAASEGTLLTLNAKGRLSPDDEILTQIKGHTVAFDPDKDLVLIPGGREGKSKLLIFRPMKAQGQQSSSESAEARVQ